MSFINLKQKLAQTYSSLKFKVSQLHIKKTYFALVLLVLAIPVTILLASQQQIFKQNAAGPAGCQPDIHMVNPCSPWIGAAAKGNPGIPGQTKPGNDLISQFDYLSQLVGHPLDVFRDYHSPLSDTTNPNSTLPFDPTTTAGKVEITLANRPGVYVDINWDVSHNWQQAMPVSQGGDPTINAQIATAAKNIKAIAPNKIFLSPWHEGNDHISPNTGAPGCSHYNPTAGFGSPSQFIAAWQNIYNIFKAQGITNVVWTLNFGAYAPNSCWVPQMWPGNQYVDWVIYDTYGRGKTWDQSAGVMYNTLAKYDSATVNTKSKPWGIGEFGNGDHSATDITDTQYFQSINPTAYPRLKMYLVYADTGGPGSSLASLTDYSINRPITQPPTYSYDPGKQAAFNQFVDKLVSVIPTVSPSVPVSPSPSISLSPSPGKGETIFSLTLCPHDIGNCGDNANPQGNGNTNAKHQTRSVTLSLFSNSTTPVATANGTVRYIPGSQNFQGDVHVTNLPAGNYFVKLAMPGYLVRQTPGVITIGNGGGKIDLPEAFLITGDLNNDNQLNILDYNVLVSCFENGASSSSCPSPITSTNTGADLDDNGVVDIIDMNMFLRELAVQSGAGGGGQPTPTPEPSISPAPISSGYQVVGNKIVMPNGNRYVPYGFVLECLGRANFTNLCKTTAKDPNTDSDKIKAIANFWHGNTVRLQVAQENLFHSSPYDTNFVSMMDNEVSLANSLNMVVILTLQEEEYKGPPFPTQSSIQFWQFMANHYKNNPRVFFDLYNEPQLITTESTMWNLWQNGGTFNGKNYVGFQALVNTIRGQGSNNIIIAEANQWDKDLTQLPTHYLSGSNIAYGVEPNLYSNSRTPQQWYTNFGQYTKTVPIMPEAFRDNDGKTCDTNSPADVPPLFNYLASIPMGAIVWTLAPGISTTGNSLTSPTNYNGLTTISCPSSTANILPTNTVGPGADILSLFKANSIPQQ